MSLTIYVFVCTEGTYALNVPAASANLADFQRRTHNAFSAITNGFRRVGDLRFAATSDAIDFHVMCDGATHPIARFPQLFALYGNRFGGDGVTTFAVPNALDAVSFATSAPTQTVTDGGSVVIGTPTPTPTPTGGQTGGTGQNTSSGGRPRNPFERVP